MEKHIIKFKETSREEELEFYSSNFLSEKRIEFEKIEETKQFPLIQQIFYLPFVKKVILNKRSVYIEKLNILDWKDVQNELCKQMQDFLNEGGLVSQIDQNKNSPTTVYAESTPNPNVMKFVVNKKIVKGVYEFKNVNETQNAPIAKSLFTFPFVKEVFLDFNFISVTQNSDSNWEENTMDVREFIRSYIQDNNTLIHEDLIEDNSNVVEVDFEKIDDVSKEIIDIIEKHVKPAVAADGGNIVFQSYDQETKNVNVILQGACSGCPSSTVTLKSGIENMLKEMLPGMISDVNAING
ncbi:NifU family protein [Flavobacteriaceae bacterium]|jgi:Fe-S cluster biogenesis protein NfuA|nr:NifU family protein [Flavobacteriaceae bacterium]|tara:strand:- start:8905 stop:9792 length:888 start_codon:yes stop_codon:yes gene_type:complete